MGLGLVLLITTIVCITPLLIIIILERGIKKNNDD